jgi:hypothetical protein
MAETQKAPAEKAPAGKATRVYIPEPGVHVQTASSEEYPGGRVVHLTHGWTDLEGDLASNRLLKGLAKSPEESTLLEEFQKGEALRAEEAAKAQDKFVSDSIALQDGFSTKMYEADVARAKRLDEGRRSGSKIDPIDELPLDPQARQAIILTANPHHGMVSAAGMAGKAEVLPTAPGTGEPEGPATAPPVNRDVPQVSGDPIVGGTLACTMGNWDNMSAEPHSYAYQWKSDASNVGVGSANYVAAESDVGKTITCVVTATNALGSTAAPPSNGIVVTGNGATHAAHARRATA